LTFVAACVFLATTLAAAAPNALPAGAIDRILDNAIGLGSPGCALSVLRQGMVAYVGARGLADLDYDLPLTRGSIFYIASDSKQFTAFSVALLVDEGTVRLDDSVTRWIPELPSSVYGAVTIADLIHHTGGVRDYWGLLELEGQPSTGPFPQSAFLRLMARQKALNFKPGDRFEYSNSGYALLAIVVGRASGRPLPIFAREEIFDPLGMRHTSYGANHLITLENRALGYHYSEGGYQLDQSNIEPLGDGGVRTTVTDITQWLANLEHNRLGRRPANVSSLALAKGTLNDGTQVPYAFGLAFGSHDGYEMIDHTGSYGGYQSFVAWLPRPRLGVVALCNGDGPFEPWTIGLKVIDLYLGTSVTPSPAPTGSVFLDAQQRAKITGLFQEPDGTVWKVTPQSGGAVAEVQGLTLHLRALDRTQLHAIDAPQPVDLFITSAGLILQVGHGSRETLQPFMPPTLSSLEIAEYSGTYYSDELDVMLRVYGRTGNLYVDREPAEESLLEPVSHDEFRKGSRRLVFVRNSAGVVDGIQLEASGVDGLRFVKSDRLP
jgi:CubicO group peptidase (beta-lactamase class C family)